MTLQDGLETVTVTAVLPSARFAMYINGEGNKLAFFKSADRTIPAGKTSTLEISADTQVYIGNDTLEDYILSIVNQ